MMLQRTDEIEASKQPTSNEEASKKERKKELVLGEH
jgi:hypothetical protein